jgi:hypothetical protein
MQPTPSVWIQPTHPFDGTQYLPLVSLAFGRRHYRHDGLDYRNSARKPSISPAVSFFSIRVARGPVCRAYTCSS